MTLGIRSLLLFFIFIQSATAARAAAMPSQSQPVLADAQLLREIGARVLAVEPSTQVGFAVLNEEEQARLSEVNHDRGRCGGFEVLDVPTREPMNPLITSVFGQLAEQEARAQRYHPQTQAFANVQERPEITAALAEVSPASLKQTVDLLSSFPSRRHTLSDANVSIEALKNHIETVIGVTSRPYQIDFITHRSTRQKSIRVRFPGVSRPSEIIVIGAHADSINRSASQDAPGADDDASGTADVVEVARLLARQPQGQRTIDLFWYAGEEGGLLGSSEIAADYAAQKQDVVGVMQLDMTLFPGDGEFVIGSMTDFTSPSLRDYFATLNGLYTKFKILDDKCGYGCSDHASWHRRGFATVMPSEATFSRMNKNLHTTRDVIDARSNFEHSAIFSRIALAFAMDLGNSMLRP